MHNRTPEMAPTSTSITTRYTGVIHLQHLDKLHLTRIIVYDPLMRGAPAGE